MSNNFSQPPHIPKKHDSYEDRKLLKDLPFYRRYPRTFVIVGSSIGFLILFSKGFYDFFKPNSPNHMKKRLHEEKIKQLKLQRELK